MRLKETLHYSEELFGGEEVEHPLVLTTLTDIVLKYKVYVNGNWWKKKY